MTNFEMIKDMGIEDFTSWLSNLTDCENCTIRKCDGHCYEAWLRWLKSENAEDKLTKINAQVKQAVKEFAEKVKKCSYCDNVFMDGKWHRYVLVDDIDELLNEYEK